MTRSCYHCGSAVTAKSDLQLELGGALRSFCCPGCLAIAKTIHGEGLDMFYARRVPGIKPEGEAIEERIPERLLPYNDPLLLERFTKPAQGPALETTLKLEKIRCAACVWLCEHHIKRIPGVTDVQINYATQKAKVVFNPAQASLAQLLHEVERVGYGAWPFEPSLAIEKSKKERRQLLTRLGVALLGMMQVMMYAWPSYVGENDITSEYGLLLNWASWVLTVPVMVYSAGPIFQSAWHSVRLFPKSKMLGMDVPIALALALAFIAGTINLLAESGESYFDSITMFVAFILGARYIELLARQDAQGGAEALAKQLPATCERFVNYPETSQIHIVPVVKCHVGDYLRIAPGAVIPADGALIEGESALDESLLTGEAKPVSKIVGDVLYAGTHNVQNAFVMKIIAVGQSTRIAGIASLLDQALLAKPNVVGLAEKWAGHFILFLLLSAAISTSVWLYVDPSKAWTVLVAVLVASCPCALSLAVPTAMAAAQGAVTKLGLLIVRGHVMESLVKVSDIVLDKTGTLTVGQPELKEIQLFRSDVDKKTAFAIAAAMEEGLTHPLGLSLLRAADAQGIERATLNAPISNRLGFGIQAGDFVLGSQAWLESTGHIQSALEPQSGEYGSVFLADAKGLIARFLFLDTPRAGVSELLATAQRRGIRIHILSGDDALTVAWWAQYFGITLYQGASSPEGKYAFIEQLQAEGRFVWAIGDGINDAPFLAKANISVAVGSGAPLAAAGADAILTASSLAPLAKALIMADRTQSVIKQNLFWAFIYNLVAIPVAMMGWVNPWIAGVGMALSSLAVTLNAWRLRKI
ncbi:MAG: heavy metal translocating P-type ATPase [Polynucleobacter sp.]|nr:heavy metal translocating P-type ATPase [Polynucleobacter sp.]